jgi:hypothetical protein
MMGGDGGSDGNWRCPIRELVDVFKYSVVITTQKGKSSVIHAR